MYMYVYAARDEHVQSVVDVVHIHVHLHVHYNNVTFCNYVHRQTSMICESMVREMEALRNFEKLLV